MNLRRSDGSPLTSIRSSGAKVTLNKIPSSSRAFGNGEPFCLALFAFPGVISTSKVMVRDSCSTTT